ncbi:hypothetical protein B8W66_16700 [Mycobacterium decipiens]|uniref:PPE domain-containing protein n=1 Tax=Mycobacterium decipiens TaxID=1430326 RepID=A0A1X2LRZ8_9MYCO|nr:hypothetical protein B8W66_16700 [Mycobacterium decipiens]
MFTVNADMHPERNKELPSYAAIPPEENARRFFAGPGPYSVGRAGMAWRRLADDLYTAACDINRALTTLTGAWQSKAATEMTQAAAPYLAWLNDTAKRASSTAALASCTVDAWQWAARSMVPTETVAANVAWRKQLYQTNHLGQNFHEIACCEAEYQNYWDTNARTMESYRGVVEFDMRWVQPFVEAPKITVDEVSRQWAQG